MRPDGVCERDTDRLWALRDLPPFPWIAIKVLQLLTDARADDVEICRLVELIRADASLSSELLRRANSPVYGLRARIASVQHAVVVLGFDRVKTLALTVGVGAYLKTALKLELLRRCWRHSLACAILSEELSRGCLLPVDQAYTAGLLHDIGRLALLVKHPQAYAGLLEVIEENCLPALESERDLFGVDHCEAGAWLARHWDFPPQLAEVAAQHHLPPADGRMTLIRLVHLACRLADALGFQVFRSSQSEDPALIFGELPRRCLYLLDGGPEALKDRVTTRVNELE
ncbi:MAG: HDOD domain-containing protein [Bryobacteraceae bacterium]|nr:HDOD domain-containing protein [Bryobacteraceae bacterium]